MSAPGQLDFLEGDIHEVIAANERADAERRAARERAFEARKAVLMADTAAWKDGPFAQRVEALLGNMAALGEPGKDMHDIILIGINDAAKAGRLDERIVSFQEEKSRQTVARVAAAGQIVPTVWRDRGPADLKEVGVGCIQLPIEIQTAGLAKINQLGHSLAQLGFKSQTEVDPRASAPARELADRIRDVYSSLVLLSAARYRAAKDYKNVNPDKLDRMETFATQACDFDTRAFPGVKMDLPLTSDGRLLSTEGRAPRRVVSKQEAAASAKRADDAGGMYVGKIIDVSDTTALQKVGRSPDDLVLHDLQALNGADDLGAGEIVTISYAMGLGQVSGRNRGRENVGIDR